MYQHILYKFNLFLDNLLTVIENKYLNVVTSILVTMNFYVNLNKMMSLLRILAIIIINYSYNYLEIRITEIVAYTITLKYKFILFH
jgi:hypothetical protein